MWEIINSWLGLIGGIIAILAFLGFADYKTLFGINKKTPIVAPNSPELQPTGTIDFSRLPRPSAELIGRETELLQLTEALTTQKHLAYIYAAGGIGKSALIFKWLHLIQPDYRGASKVFAWSFYSQGSHDTQNSSIPFFQEALPFFGYSGELPKDDVAKGRALAKCLRDQSFILILDGLEPLQHPTNILEGELKDKAIQALIDEIHYGGLTQSPSLVVVSSRQPLQELESWESERYLTIELQKLSDELGMKLLKSLKVIGTDEELKQATQEMGGHALALVLLGKMLVAQFNGDIARRDQLPPLWKEKTFGQHAERVLNWYVMLWKSSFFIRLLLKTPLAFWAHRWESKELSFMNLLSLFDRPLGIDEKRILLKRAQCAAPLRGLGEMQWQQLEKSLENAGLLLHHEGMRAEWDCHPLIRSYFAQQFKATHPDLFRQAHLVLFEYYQQLPEKQQPDTLEELEPLYRAVVHGCLAGEYQKAKNIHQNRILRGDEIHYSWHSLGLYSLELSTLLSFFPKGWEDSAQNGLPLEEQAWLMMEVSFCLSSLGRVQESIEPKKQAIKLYAAVENWEKSAICARNLVDSMLSTGKLETAYAISKQPLEYAKKSRLWFEELRAHVAIASVLYLQGKLDLATKSFAEAEKLQKEKQPEHQQLVSISGFWYSSLLLQQSTSEKQLKNILERGEYSLKVSTEKKWIHIAALDNLIIARTYHKLNELGKAEEYFNQAVTAIKSASRRDFACFFYIDRANFYLDQQQFDEAKRDLAEAWQIIKRSDMKLYAVDYHLAMCRAEPEKAQFHETEAKKLIAATGYHLRDKNV